MGNEHVRPLPPHPAIAPRADGPLPLRYRTAPPDEAAWCAGAAAGELWVPDPWMNFSTSGLAFDDLPRCTDGQRLLLELDVPGGGTFRAVGEVVRVSRIPIDERDEGAAATHRIALRFVSLPGGAEEALRAYTLRLRQAMGREE